MRSTTGTCSAACSSWPSWSSNRPPCGPSAAWRWRGPPPRRRPASWGSPSARSTRHDRTSYGGGSCRVTGGAAQCCLRARVVAPPQLYARRGDARRVPPARWVGRAKLPPVTRHEPRRQCPLGKRIAPPSDRFDDRLQVVRRPPPREKGYGSDIGDCLHPGNATRTRGGPAQVSLGWHHRGRTPPRSRGDRSASIYHAPGSRSRSRLRPIRPKQDRAADRGPRRVQILSPRLFSERSPSARTSKGFLISGMSVAPSRVQCERTISRILRFALHEGAS